MPDGYEVGYGKPPKETQFAKGRSGNRKGRPKGSKNIATTFHEITDELIHVTENGKSRSMTKLHAIMLQMVNKAVSGDVKTAKEVLQWNQIFLNDADRGSANNPDTAKNEAVMRSFIRKVKASSTDRTSASNEPAEETAE
jgi:hypothetical protein